jgi:hypothetical protein
MGDWHTIPGTSTSTSTTQNFENHGRFNGPYGGNIGYSETITNTYGSQLQNITSSGYAAVPPGTAINNGFLTNIAILPYIRPQQIVIKSKGLLVNTPISTFFDGKDVGQYMSAPNTIELLNVNNANGGFQENDIVGFYLAGTGNFFPVARVTGVYNYPNGTSCRLYVAKIIRTADTFGTTTIQNAKFDSNGTYLASGNTAQGTLTSNYIINLHQSGTVAGVGGGYANVLAGSATTQYYVAPDVGNYSSFLNHYGIWGDQDNTANYNAAFPVTFVNAGTYTVTVACSGSATAYYNGAGMGGTGGTPTEPQVSSVAITTGTQTISWSAASSGTTTSAFAMTMHDPFGNLVFDTTNPVYYSTFATPTGVVSEIIMPGGGAWFTGVTQVKLGQDASTVSNFYVGSTINITSKYVYEVTVAATYVPPPPAPSGGGGGGGRVICTHMTEIGEMSLDDLAADLEFTKQINLDTVKGYYSWAFFIVEHMRKHPTSLVTVITKYLAQHRTNEIKYQLGLTDKPDYIGKYVRFFGETYCWGLGTLINNSNMVGIKEKIQSRLEQAEKTLKEPSMNYIAKVYEKAFK